MGFVAVQRIKLAYSLAAAGFGIMVWEPILPQRESHRNPVSPEET
jgi:hypothetical protein